MGQDPRISIEGGSQIQAVTKSCNKVNGLPVDGLVYAQGISWQTEALCLRQVLHRLLGSIPAGKRDSCMWWSLHIRLCYLDMLINWSQCADTKIVLVIGVCLAYDWACLTSDHYVNFGFLIIVSDDIDSIFCIQFIFSFFDSSLCIFLSPSVFSYFQTLFLRT